MNPAELLDMRLLFEESYVLDIFEEFYLLDIRIRR